MKKVVKTFAMTFVMALTVTTMAFAAALSAKAIVVTVKAITNVIANILILFSFYSSPFKFLLLNNINFFIFFQVFYFFVTIFS